MTTSWESSEFDALRARLEAVSEAVGKALDTSNEPPSGGAYGVLAGPLLAPSMEAVQSYARYYMRGVRRVVDENARAIGEVKYLYGATEAKNVEESADVVAEIKVAALTDLAKRPW